MNGCRDGHLWGIDVMKETGKGIAQLIKYNVVGVMNTAVDFIVYQILMFLGVHYALAQCLSYSCGIVNSYFFNSRWTFRGGEKKYTSSQFLRFILVNLISLAVSVALLKVCYQVIGIESDLYSKAIVTPVVMVINFLGTKLFVFRR